MIFLVALLALTFPITSLASRKQPNDLPSKTYQRRIIAKLKTCPKVVEYLGQSIRITGILSMGWVGVWRPPIPGCTHQAYVKGSLGNAILWFSAINKPYPTHYIRRVMIKKKLVLTIILTVTSCLHLEIDAPTNRKISLKQLLKLKRMSRKNGRIIIDAHRCELYFNVQ
ncbi:hypothetical protein TI03_00420 [Achromatium sp. WMS1]|nr:hypothetical protein TI03_00420 [Achromatium sp. WMS1]